MKVFAINGSPRKSQGKTAKILAPFLDRLHKQGAEISLHYASSMKIKPCSCGKMLCWNRTPGKCIHKDDMQAVMPVLKESQIWVLATPIYIPLPGAMQNFLNRLCPLLDPELNFRQGRTRARLREDVKLEKIVLVSTGGWWERANVDTVERIFKHFAVVADIPFAGAVVRPHASLMWQHNALTDDGAIIVKSIQHAADELLQEGIIRPETQTAISAPLISQEEFFKLWAGD